VPAASPGEPPDPPEFLAEAASARAEHPPDPGWRGLAGSLRLTDNGRKPDLEMSAHGLVVVPACGQALCWSFLLGRKAQQSPIFKDEVLKETGHLPFWLEHNGEEGFGVVCYDNFFIAVGAERVEMRPRENAAAFNIEVKGEICAHSCQQPATDPHRAPLLEVRLKLKIPYLAQRVFICA
jgi:hypothetical protein